MIQASLGLYSILLISKYYQDDYLLAQKVAQLPLWVTNWTIKFADGTFFYRQKGDTINIKMMSQEKSQSPSKRIEKGNEIRWFRTDIKLFIGKEFAFYPEMQVTLRHLWHLPASGQNFVHFPSLQLLPIVVIYIPAER